MYELMRIIKATALEAVEAEKPLAMVWGRVTRQEKPEEDIPLEITLEQKTVIGREFLYETPEVEGLKKGDRLIMLRQRGGQEYLILKKLGSGGDAS